ncbi:MAG TPA: flagellar motor switch protein FliN [Solirubrobacteraceae bacterium]|jgi:flagellar motor switch protein FliN/FliY|nr:flagellar motor switch protein FliN [Solirubrobacteraceae bacterium]
MAETIEYQQFEQPAATGGSLPGGDVDLSRLSDIPMELSVEIGRTHMTVGETLDLRVGSVVALERLAGETADLLVNGTAIARGEVVVIDEQYGLRITEILDGHGEGELAPAPADAPSGRAGAAGAAPEEPSAAGPGGEAAAGFESEQPPATAGADTQDAGPEVGEGRAADER